MEKIIGSAMMSCRPELLGEIHDVKIKRIAEGMQKISQMICQYKPQTIVLLTPQKMFANALTIHVQPRLKGNMSKYGLTDMVLGFEIDSLLMHSIINQSKRIGIELEELSEQAEGNHLAKDMDEQSFVPLYYLYKAGFKGQVVSIGCDRLPFEEMYTFGKGLQVAIDKANKKVLAISVGAFHHFGQPDKKVIKDVSRLVEHADVKALLDMDETLLASQDAEAFSKLFFCLGVVGGKKVTPQIFTEDFIAEGQCIFLLQNRE